MIKKWLNKLSIKTVGVDFMDTVESVQKSKQTLKEHEELVDKTYNEVMTRIEKVCRVQTFVIVKDLGFGNMSTPLYPTSYQKKVVDKLSMDGYLCTVSINYNGGKVSSKLTVRW